MWSCRSSGSSSLPSASRSSGSRRSAAGMWPLAQVEVDRVPRGQHRQRVADHRVDRETFDELREHGGEGGDVLDDEPEILIEWLVHGHLALRHRLRPESRLVGLRAVGVGGHHAVGLLGRGNSAFVDRPALLGAELIDGVGDRARPAHLGEVLNLHRLEQGDRVREAVQQMAREGRARAAGAREQNVLRGHGSANGTARARPSTGLPGHARPGGSAAR